MRLLPDFRGARWLRFVLCMVLLTLSGNGLAQQGEEEDKPLSPEALQQNYQVQLELLGQGFEAQRDTVRESYARALDRVQASFQEKGDLENVLKVKNERELILSEGISGTETFPGSDRLRWTLSTEIGKVDVEEADKVLQIQRIYLDQMKQGRVALLKSGDVDGAMKLDQQVKQLNAFLESGGASGVAMTTIRQKAESPAFEEEAPLIGYYELDPGRYDLPSWRVIIGDRSKGGAGGLPRDEIEATLVVPDGSELREGQFFIDLGWIKASESRFESVQFEANLGGEMEAADSFFVDCTFNKGGGWFSNYSSRWTFENCVFKGSAFLKMHTQGLGVKLTDCTFEDLTLPEMEWRTDASEEAINEWRTIENCLFVNCEIPVSFLLATDKCVFRDCTFVEDSKPLVTSETVSATLYLDNTDPPLALEGMAFSIRDASGLNRDPGATLDPRLSLR